MNNFPRILVIEDAPVAQIVIKIQMEKYGCSVDAVSDGLLAIKKAKDTSYDLILTDIGLGEGPDGLEVAAAIRLQSPINKNTPVMVVTAQCKYEYNEKAKQIGVVGYFSKPFRPDDAKTIMDYLNKFSDR